MMVYIIERNYHPKIPLNDGTLVMREKIKSYLETYHEKRMGKIMSTQTIFELLHTIEQVTHKMHVKWRQQVDYDLGVSHIVALHELQMNGESRPSELARLLNFTPASLTHLSTKLSNKELITRRQDDTDRRIIYWKITQKGEDLLNQAQKDGQDLRMKVFSHLTETEQQSLLSIYTKLNKSLI